MKSRENEIPRPYRSRTYVWMLLLFVAGLAAITAVAVAETPDKASRGLALMGQSLYRDYCTSCHGAKGRGDGPVAEALHPAPADLTRLTGEDGKFPYESVLKKIDGREEVGAHGSSDMPIWGDALQVARGGSDEADAENKIVALTHYLWTIQAGEEAGR